MLRTFLILGSLNMFLSVALGAFGAHGLKSRISADMLTIYQTGVHYHMIHALGIIAVALAASKLPAVALISWAGWSMLIGIVLFSGSLYALSITGIKVLGAITPFGGVAFLLGWLLLAYSAYKGL